MIVLFKNISFFGRPVFYGSTLLVVLFFYSCSTEIQLPEVLMETPSGNIILEIDTVSAPVTAKNFLSLVDREAYKNSCFYRVVRMNNQPGNAIKIEVIQGGLRNDSLIDTFTPILHETTQMTGLKHLNGTLSMARNQPGTASTEFFICIGDQPELDFGGKRNPDGQGFAAFGRVKEGMVTVRKIQGQTDSSQYLLNPVKVSIRRY